MNAIDTLVTLIESRINGDSGHDTLINDWIHVAISLIPKVKNANTAKKWRPIALTSCLQKVYLAVVTKLVQFYSEPCHHMQYGFSSGKQVMEITELCRLAAQKSTRWDTPLFTMKLDVHRAFDALRHGVIHAALERALCPVRLQLAMLRELAHCDITLNFQGSVWEDIMYSKGGKQGGSDTPELWKRVLDVALRQAKCRWDALSLGASFGQESKSHGDTMYIDGVAWADDIILFANSLESMKLMFRILVEELKTLYLEIKPGSLEVMSNFGDIAHEVMYWDAGGIQHKVLTRHSLNILGITIDESGTDSASIDHRIAQAWHHFLARRKSFCNNIIPLKLRWRRIRDTVYKTLLHGSGGWLINENTRKKLRSFEFKVLCQTLCRGVRADESPGDYHERNRMKIQDLQDLFQWVPLAKLAANNHLSWWGHVARIPDPSPLRLLLKWRNLKWETTNNVLGQGTKIVQRRNGHNWNIQGPRGPEACLETYMGQSWETEALDRDRWSTLKAEVLENQLGVQQHASLLQPSSNRCRDWTRGCHIKLMLRLLIIVENPQISHQTNGVWQHKSRSVAAPYVAFLKWNVHALHRLWKFSCAHKGEPLIQSRPRAQNRHTDDLAKLVEKTGEAAMQTCVVQLNALDLLVLTSSGHRGNTGFCTCAAGLHVYRDGVGMILLGKWGIPMGHCTKVVAEFEGACLSIRLLMLWCIQSNIVS
jgi:hypothetical protein